MGQHNHLVYSAMTDLFAGLLHCSVHIIIVIVQDVLDQICCCITRHKVDKDRLTRTAALAVALFSISAIVTVLSGGKEEERYS